MEPPNAMQIQVPGVELAGVNVAIGPVPGRPSMRQIIIGPIMLTLPLDENARKSLVRGLTGLHIASPGENGAG